MALFPLCYDWWHSIVCMCHIFFIHSPVNGHLASMPCLLWTGLLWTLGFMCLFEIVFVFSRYMPRSGIDGSYDNSLFSLLRNLCTAVHGGCVDSHPQQQCRRFPCLCAHCHYFPWSPLEEWHQGLEPGLGGIDLFLTTALLMSVSGLWQQRQAPRTPLPTYCSSKGSVPGSVAGMSFME